MMLARVVALIILTILPVQAPRNAKSQSSNSVKPDGNANQTPSVQSPPPVPQKAPEENQNQRGNVTSTNKDQSVQITSVPKVFIESKKDLYDKALVFATSLLVIVGGFQIFYLWKTVTAASIAAAAAKKSAEALINSERAWLLVEVVPWSELEGTVWIRPNASDEGINATFSLECENAGRSPCWIIEKWARLEFVGIKIPGNPPEPFFKVGDFRNLGIETIPVGKPEPTRRTEVTVENPNHRPTDGRVIIYGFVRYRDIFGKLRETWFGYDVGLRDNITRIDLRAYNQHT